MTGQKVGCVTRYINGAAASVTTTAISTGTVSMTARDKARMQAMRARSVCYVGNFTLMRNCTCMKCNTCGGTSGS